MPPEDPSAVRSERLACCVAALAVVAVGLVWRWPALGLPHFIGKYGADALWAALVFLLSRFLFPRWPVWRSAAAAFVFSVAVEFSQLYHAPWLDSIRATRPGALILGSIFNAPDIAAYTIGISITTLLRLAFGRRFKPVTP